MTAALASLSLLVGLWLLRRNRKRCWFPRERVRHPERLTGAVWPESSNRRGWP
jgi:hypothetical protein